MKWIQVSLLCAGLLGGFVETFKLRLSTLDSQLALRRRLSSRRQTEDMESDESDDKLICNSVGCHSMWTSTVWILIQVVSGNPQVKSYRIQTAFKDDIKAANY